MSLNALPGQVEAVADHRDGERPLFGENLEDGPHADGQIVEPQGPFDHPRRVEHEWPDVPEDVVQHRSTVSHDNNDVMTT
ncbi:hypothetical protein Aca07nite_80570 [Actinoplanes capillaceus]|uniref:Uncharacterized protein n=1 Tax=Actinoplanes campanulatus TaxID=113559 RepID=A0ABQ3WWW4_9ACTN|nr:hypothetical protein Aca07nite_80570 [Actinoplanes capillaceus]